VAAGDETSAGEGPNDGIGHSDRSLRVRARQFLAFTLASVYVAAVLVWPPNSWSPWLREWLGYPKRGLHLLIERFFAGAGISAPSNFARNGAYFLLVQLIIPWAVMLLLGRGRPRELGLRRPNRLALRIIPVAYLIALPFLIWMVRSPGFAPYYRPAVQQSATGFLSMYLIAIVGEHFLFHGVLLTVFHPLFCWPTALSPAQPRAKGARGALQWLGAAQASKGGTRWNRWEQWLGLRDGCLTAMLASAALFALIHLSKDPRETLLSIPGGIAEAYLAYRTDSLLTPLLLHLATAGTATFAMILLR
jgi:hypothetical protein